MNTIYQFFDYERCFVHYTERIMQLRQAKLYGEVIVAKPVLLLAVIDGIEEGIFVSNGFALDEWLENRYTMLMKQYTRHYIFDKVTPINNPFWHLQGDGFWHLRFAGGQQPKEKSTPSTAWLRDNTKYAYVDNDLWVLLQNAVMRQRLHDYIIENKLIRHDDNRLLKAAERIGMIAGVIMAVA